jgi:hypothetical protein
LLDFPAHSIDLAFQLVEPIGAHPAAALGGCGAAIFFIPGLPVSILVVRIAKTTPEEESASLATFGQSLLA